VGLSQNDLNIYKSIIESVIPNYAQYTFKLLEADTYFPYTTFGRESTINPIQDLNI